MKIGAYIEVAIVAFPYKFCRMINILFDEEEGNWRCLPLVLGILGKEITCLTILREREGEGDAGDPPPQRLQSPTESGRCIEV